MGQEEGSGCRAEGDRDRGVGTSPTSSPGSCAFPQLILLLLRHLLCNDLNGLLV